MAPGLRASKNRKAQKIVPLDQRAVSGVIKSVTTDIQNIKVEHSRKIITRLQYKGDWGDDYDSFHTSQQRSNRYKNPEKFFSVMRNSPKLYAKKFIFSQEDTGAGKAIQEATYKALRIVLDQSRKYLAKPNISGSDNYSTGLYNRNIKIGLDGANVTSINQLKNLPSTSVTYIANTVPYAGASEANALYYAKVGGIIFYAAQQIKRAYKKQLAISFKFYPAEYIDGTSSYYQVPTLQIAAKGNIDSRMSTPGKNQRSRSRNSLKAYRDKLAKKAAARTAAGRRGEYG